MALDRDLITRALPNYEIGGEIGRGGWGVVLAGRHRGLDRPVAIKQLPRAFAADAEVQRRFAGEARMLASLDHPHVVPIYDYVEHEGLCLLVMELLPGGTLWERFTGEGLSPQASCGIVLAACTALEYAHQAGMLHRDVKPDNLLFTASGTVKVSDFGIAKMLGDDRTLATKTGEVLGTPTYMAPEQALGQVLTPATDLYSLGILTYELLAGRTPFVDDGNPVSLLIRHVQEEPIPLSSAAPQVPVEVADVVMGSLAREPADRPQTVEAFGTALADACNRAWGRGWARSSGVAVMASGAIAARISNEPELGAPPPSPESPPPPLASPVRARPTMVDLPSTPVVSPSPANVVEVVELMPDEASGPPPPPPPALTPQASPSAPPAAPPPVPAGSPPPPSPPRPARSRSGLARVLLVAVPVIVVIGIVVAVLALAGGGDGGGDGGGGDGSGSGSSDEIDVTVPGNREFVDTGIDVAAGDTVTVDATGSVIHDNETDPTLASPPDGDADRPDLKQFNVPELPDADHANLIGKIGAGGTPFVVGSHLELVSDADGRLFLGINDVGVFNNGGQYDALVSVTSP